MEVIKNKLNKNFKHKKKWARKSNIEAYRLYDREIPDYPYIIDVYDDKFLIYSKTKEKLDSDKTHYLDHIIDSLIEICTVDRSKIIVKERKIQTRHEKYVKNPIKADVRQESEGSSQTQVIGEYDAKFEVNLYDYIDTGLFLDHRPLRQLVAQKISQMEAPRFLNLFSYTCSVSVFAAISKAHTTSIDLSSKYLEWGKRNFQLNDINPEDHKFIKSDILEFLTDFNLKKEKVKKFDLIFLDPPTFSNSKKMTKHFDVEEDQDFIINQSMKLLNENGILYFSNNLRSFKLSQRTQDEFKVKDITAQSIPQDFKDTKIHHLFEITHK